uniref:Uncharacterized protein n=1 Tax=Fowl aviadenovirus 4 TaxID=130663 RepID=Q30BR3_FADV4|nr:unknown [Fowl aviadenovirus 4]
MNVFHFTNLNKLQHVFCIYVWIIASPGYKFTRVITSNNKTGFHAFSQTKHIHSTPQGISMILTSLAIFHIGQRYIVTRRNEYGGTVNLPPFTFSRRTPPPPPP